MSFAFLIIASLMEKEPAGHSHFVSAARLVVGLKCYVITFRKLKWAMKARLCYNGDLFERIFFVFRGHKGHRVRWDLQDHKDPRVHRGQMDCPFRDHR